MYAHLPLASRRPGCEGDDPVADLDQALKAAHTVVFSE
jgi:hypothetical protein